MNDELNEEESREMENLKRTVMNRVLEKEAYERLARLRLVNPNLANHLEMYLLQLYQNDQIKGIITDDQLKKILSSINTKRDFKIIR
ncbi:MAG: DNA-binding protein [Candidatus Aenigmarchaeota archaeon]|nr:DNA-binding protein [Candidatus Aenigmarchaeota archaeon]